MYKTMKSFFAVILIAFAFPSVAMAGDSNSAVFPVSRNDWMERVLANIRAAREPEIQVIFDGDSITDGWRRRGRTVWDARYAGYKAVNFGIGGDRTEHVLWRLRNGGQVDGMSPRLVVLMIGTNNLGRNTNEQIVEGVFAVVREYRRRCPGAVVLLQGIFPRGKLSTDPVRERIKAINQELAKVSDGGHVLYVDIGEKFLDASGNLPESIMPDYLHPDPQGYEVWAEAIEPIIKKILTP
jgi:lysophospholipase L1-like esterase